MKIGRSVSTQIAAHNVLKTGVHGVGAKYIAKATASSQLVANADIKDSAGIAYSKLALAGELLAADIKAGADIPLSKLVDAVCSETEAGTIAAAAVAAKITSGSYTGNNADNRAIPHGLGVTPKIVIIGNPGATKVGSVAGTIGMNLYSDTFITVTACDNTNFYVSNTTISLNTTGQTFHWVAFG